MASWRPTTEMFGLVRGLACASSAISTTTTAAAAAVATSGANTVSGLGGTPYAYVQRASLTTGDEDEMDGNRPTTPWVRQVISGVDLMRHPKYNKGLAFSDDERDRLYIRGLLPPAVLSPEVQLERIIMNIRNKKGNLEKFAYLQSLQERSERLFFRVLSANLEELLPIVYDPTVRTACQKNSLMFKSVPRALFISLEDRGRVFRILKNWPERNIRLVCLSDGERVIHVGDIGVQSVGLPIAKLSMYTACGGIPPHMCLPIAIDCGTDNETLLNSPFYVGLRHKRVRGDAYYELLDEVLSAVQARFGNTTMLQFQDMAHENASKLLNMYRKEFPCFNDDMTGQAATLLAAILGAWPKTGTQLGDHIILFSGEGPFSAVAAELIAGAIAARSNTTILEARKNIWLVDSKGLVTRERGDSGELEWSKLPFCHSGPSNCDLLSAVETLKPTVLIGCSSEGEKTPFQFDQQVIQSMSTHTRNPLVLPMSGEVSEASRGAASIYEWSEGRALVATYDRTEPVEVGGQTFAPSHMSSLYIFPGVGLGTLISKCTKLRDEQFVAAAEAVARMLSDKELEAGSILPHISRIRDVSAHVATAVASKAYSGGYATALPKPHNLQEVVTQNMYNPAYQFYR